MDPDFKWPQLWTTNLAVDQRLPGDILGTFEFVFSKDINAIFMRNADLRRTGEHTCPTADRSTVALISNELNADDGSGIYVIDNTDEGYSFTFTTQLRKFFDSGLSTFLAYNFTKAENKLKSTEIASVLWQNQPVQGDPNDPQLANSEFGQRHRIVGGATYEHTWSESNQTSVGLFFEAAEGNRFVVAGGNRYSFIYAGDVNGDGQAGNDLIYIPRNATDPNEIVFADIVDGNGNVLDLC